MFESVKVNRKQNNLDLSFFKLTPHVINFELFIQCKNKHLELNTRDIISD